MKSTYNSSLQQHTFPALYRHRLQPGLIVLFNSEHAGTVLHDNRCGDENYLYIGCYVNYVGKATEPHWKKLPPGDNVTLENTKDTGFPAIYESLAVGFLVLFTSETEGTTLTSTPTLLSGDRRKWAPCTDETLWKRFPIGEQVVYVQP